MVVESPDDRVSTLLLRVLLVPAAAPGLLHARLGQHPLHVQDLDGGVQGAGGAEHPVRAEGTRSTGCLVAGHVGRLVECGLGRRGRHVSLELEVQSRPQHRLHHILGPVARFGLDL